MGQSITAELKFIFNGTSGQLFEWNTEGTDITVTFTNSSHVLLMNRTASTTAKYIVLSAYYLKIGGSASTASDWDLIEHHRVTLTAGTTGVMNDSTSNNDTYANLTSSGLPKNKDYNLKFSLTNTNAKPCIDHYTSILGGWKKLDNGTTLGTFNGYVSDGSVAASGSILLQAEAFDSNGNSLGADSMRFDYTNQTINPSATTGGVLGKTTQAVQEKSSGNLSTTIDKLPLGIAANAAASAS